MTSAVRIGNCSGFYGDRHSAMREMLTGGDLDFLTGDYLAELTMLILGRDRMKNPDHGYAKTFLTQLEECLGLAREKNVRIVTNAGGLNPAGLADAVRALADRLGVTVNVAHVEGDDLLDRAVELGLGKPLTANAYLGAWGIVDCLAGGADIVVTGRVTDASVIVGPAAAHFGWGRTDYDQLAGAVVAGHIIECGAQATGGNYAFFTEVADLSYPGFPLAEIHADGSSVITKHAGTGGQVSVGTVTAQLLYEITGARYANPDVTARMDSAVADPGRPGPCPHQRRGGRTAATAAEGVTEQHRRLPQRHDVRADGPRCRSQSGAGAAATRGRPVRQARRTALDAGPYRPSRRRHRGSGQRAAALRGPRPRPGQRRTAILLGGNRTRARKLSRFQRHRTSGRRFGVRRLHRGVRRRRRGRPRRRARRRQPHRRSLRPPRRSTWHSPPIRHCRSPCPTARRRVRHSV